MAVVRDVKDDLREIDQKIDTLRLRTVARRSTAENLSWDDKKTLDDLLDERIAAQQLMLARVN